MGLQSHQAVHHVDAGIFECACPLDIGLLVETGLEFDESDHLFARAGRLDQGVDDR